LQAHLKNDPKKPLFRAFLCPGPKCVKVNFLRINAPENRFFLIEPGPGPKKRQDLPLKARFEGKNG
jgi:hypothetical protein